LNQELLQNPILEEGKKDLIPEQIVSSRSKQATRIGKVITSLWMFCGTFFAALFRFAFCVDALKLGAKKAREYFTRCKRGCGIVTLTGRVTQRGVDIVARELGSHFFSVGADQRADRC